MLSLREECESKNEKELARDRFIFPYVFSSSISIFLNGRNRILNYTENYESQLPGYCYISRSHYIALAVIIFERVIIPRPFILSRLMFYCFVNETLTYAKRTHKYLRLDLDY